MLRLSGQFENNKGTISEGSGPWLKAKTVFFSIADNKLAHPQVKKWTETCTYMDAQFMQTQRLKN